MENEIWKDIPGYEGRYKISNYGKVWSNFKKDFMSIYVDRDGYSRVSLFKDGKQKQLQLHRLVALTFIPNPNNLPIVRHKISIANGGDNSVENLQWGTIQDNADDRTKDGLHKVAVRQALGKPVYQIDAKTKEIIKRFETLVEAAKEVNGDPGPISGVCNGKFKLAYDYYWKYVDDESPIEIQERKNNPRAIIQMDLNGNFIAEYPSALAASKATNVHQGSISKVCRGERRTASGYIWKFKD